ncbi:MULTISPECIES: HesA/MoeB/ThiF family protein [Methylosinus]|uniref:Thiamine/molybdopterin biosynthesis protein n=1 Tax=Methylosinus trichosporium (strain ATCC 35070 / NCIMB 11131 / UNIQEM 75 / OB3b) TaxID=595536 RepID=A0A2D2D1U6_METT3|nr:MULTISPECIES: ThiF family adenylyltransferase [Methylosinus]ATQ68967.1 thiamine/molybdopterin biosynthesis protein [Methylosinus trichosporium OB3b]
MSRLDRQSFLGPQSDAILEASTIGIVGLGGGGSHVGQQAAHMGIGGFVIADPDLIEDTNTNRLIGGTLADVATDVPKVAIAERLIRGLQPAARIVSVQADWRAAVDDLKLCDVIVGAVDSFKEREQLERFARRHLIPYIDIGMDVHELGGKGFLVSGQVILSMPGAPCMRCCGFITDERLAQEAKLYGAAGSRPQVVWSNGVLASTAVGLLTQLLTAWYPNPPSFVFLDYDGNRGTINRNQRMDHLKNHVCSHHPPDETGDPMFDIRTQALRPRPKPAPTSAAPPVSWWRRMWNRLRRRAG